MLLLLLAMKKILKSPDRSEEGPMVDECGELEAHRVVEQHLGTKSVMVAVLALEVTKTELRRLFLLHWPGVNSPND